MGTANIFSTKRSLRSVILGVLGSGALSIFAAMTLEYMALRGFTSASLGRILLAVAWAVGTTGIVHSEIVCAQRLRYRIPLGLAAALVLGGALYGTDAAVSASVGASALNPVQLLSLRQLFDSDFDDTVRQATDLTVTVHQNTRTESAFRRAAIRQSVYQNYPAKSLSLGFYIPASPDTVAICKYLAGQVPQIIAEARQRGTFKFKADSRSTSLNDLAFTGRVYIYHESELSLRQAADIDDAFKANGMDVELRGSDYQMARFQYRKLQSLAKLPGYKLVTPTSASTH